MRIRLSNDSGIFTHMFVDSAEAANKNTAFYKCTVWEEVCDAYQLAGDGTYLGTNLDWPVKLLSANILRVGSIPEKPGNLLKPKWDGSAWVEGTPQSELDAMAIESKNRQLIELQIQRDAAAKLLLNEKVVEFDAKISEINGEENAKP